MHRYTHSGLAVLLGAVISGAVVNGQASTPAPAPTAKPPLQVPTTKPLSPITDASGQSPISVEELRKALGSPTVVTATVAAIDYDDRVVVLRDEKGSDNAIYVGDEVKRLPNVKVGDKVRVTFYMSLASRVMQPGEASRSGATEAVVGTTGRDRPGGTASYQQRWTVTVNAVDTAQQTVTVTGEKGRIYTFKAADPSKLANVKVGDRLEIDFTAAANVNVESAN
jgi:hypothetical protein